jgi:hypothetical protein
MCSTPSQNTTSTMQLRNGRSTGKGQGEGVSAYATLLQ